MNWYKKNAAPGSGAVFFLLICKYLTILTDCYNIPDSIKNIFSKIYPPAILRSKLINHSIWLTSIITDNKAESDFYKISLWFIQYKTFVNIFLRAHPSKTILNYICLNYIYLLKHYNAEWIFTKPLQNPTKLTDSKLMNQCRDAEAQRQKRNEKEVLSVFVFK